MLRKLGIKMARGKYLSLEEARKSGKIDQFCKEHPSEGDWGVFDKTFDAMAGSDAKSSSRAVRTSSRGRGEGSSDTRTRRGTSEGASD